MNNIIMSNVMSILKRRKYYNVYKSLSLLSFAVSDFTLYQKFFSGKQFSKVKENIVNLSFNNSGFHYSLFNSHSSNLIEVYRSLYLIFLGNHDEYLISISSFFVVIMCKNLYIYWEFENSGCGCYSIKFVDHNMMKS